MALNPKVKLRANVNFPANVYGGNGITVIPAGGSYTINIEYGKFPPPIPSIPPGDIANTVALIWNAATLQYALCPVTQLLGAGVGASAALPLMDGVASVGVSVKYSREDHVHPTDTSRAPVNNPNFTGIATSVTPAPGDNSTKIATTAFVGTAITASAVLPSGSNPLMNGVAAPGVAVTYARGDHVHPTDTTLAPLASPALTGVPTAPTATPSTTSTTQIATTAFVQSAVSAGVAGVSSIGGQTGAITLNGGALASTVLTTPRYDVAQALTAAQQAQALANIGAAPYDAEAYNNILIDGGMEVDQANAGAAVNVTVNSYSLDQWLVQKTGTMVCAAQQVSDAPPGFSNSLKVTVSTAEASLAAGDYTFIANYIEGVRTSRLQFGTAGALPITIGFWTKIHRTGPYSGAIENGAQNRSYPFTFTQNVADTWEYKTVTIPGDITGTWIGNTNGAGLRLFISMAAGSTFTGTAGSWSGSLLIGATGTTNGVAATTDIFQITGVSLLPGTIVPTAAQSVLLKRSFDQELQTCRRYYQRLGGSAVADIVLQGYAAAAGNTVGTTVSLGSVMRATPTVTKSGTWGAINFSTETFTPSPTSIGWQLNATVAGGMASYGNIGGLVFDARL